MMSETKVLKKKVVVFKPVTQALNGNEEKVDKKNISDEAQYFHDTTNILEIYAIDEESGTCLSKLSYRLEDEAPNEDLLCNYITAIYAFKNELIIKAKTDISGIDIFNLEFNGLFITVLTGEILRIVINSNDRLGVLMREKCISILNNYEREHYADIAFFDGCVNSFSDFPQFVEKELDGGLKEMCSVEIKNLVWLDSPNDLKKLMIRLYKSTKIFFPAKLATLITRILEIDRTLANYYIYLMWSKAIIVPINKKNAK